MTDVPETETEEPAVETITDGFFEEELNIDANSAGDFLIELGNQLKTSNEIELNGDGWRLPFAFGEPVELDIEFEGDGEPELEIEIELTHRADEDEVPQVG